MIPLLLAGGQSKRMGTNKALIERPDGTRQLDHLLALIREVTGHDALLSTNSPEIAPTGIDVLADIRPGDGPLGALASFHHAHPGESALLIGVDLFLLGADTLRFLLDRHDSTRLASCFTNRIDHRPEPLCAIYQPDAIARASATLESDIYCARRFIDTLEPQLLELPDPVALDNANSPADLDEIFAKLRLGTSSKPVKLLYFAKLREERGTDEEQIDTLACTAAGLYEDLRFQHRLSLKVDQLRVAINGDFAPWDSLLNPNDEIVFIPPVAGG